MKVSENGAIRALLKSVKCETTRLEKWLLGRTLCKFHLTLLRRFNEVAVAYSTRKGNDKTIKYFGSKSQGKRLL
jgi:hypothetical protein